eukprot:2265761-Pleurochrysis_carterae.AAC.1
MHARLCLRLALTLIPRVHRNAISPARRLPVRDTQRSRALAAARAAAGATQLVRAQNRCFVNGARELTRLRRNSRARLSVVKQPTEADFGTVRSSHAP